MAKRHNRRSRKGFVVIPFSANLGLSALSVNTVISGGLLTLGEDLFVISIDCEWSYSAHVVDQGPIQVGFAHGDLTDVEIAEAVDASQTDPDDIIANERGRRPVRKAGSMDGSFTSSQLADGRRVRTKMRLSVGDGHTIDFWARNGDTAAFTGNTTLTVNGDIYARWQR